MWGTLSPVSAISTIRRCGFEHSLCSCFFNVESMKATFHWKLLSGQRWCPLRSPSFGAVGTECLRTSTQSFLLIYPWKGQRCVLQLVMATVCLCNSENKVVGCDNRSSLEEETNCRCFPSASRAEDSYLSLRSEGNCGEATCLASAVTHTGCQSKIRRRQISFSSCQYRSSLHALKHVSTWMCPLKILHTLPEAFKHLK